MKNEELRMKSEELRMKSEELRMKNEKLRMKNESNSYSSFRGEADILHSSFLILSLSTLLLLLLTACDDGKVEESYAAVTEGRAVHLTAVVTGTGTWPTGYTLALAGFRADDDYAAAMYTLRPDDEGHVDVTLTNLPADVTSVELCIVNTLHQRVATYARVEGSGPGTSRTIEFEAGSANVSMYHTLQTDFFDRRCISCHGGSDHAARGLRLTEGQSYSHLVGVNSQRVPTRQLVQPGNPHASVLYQVVTTDLTADWGQPHTDMLSPEKDVHLITLLSDWIRYGANP